MRRYVTRTLCCSARCIQQNAVLPQQSVQHIDFQLRRYASSSSWDLAGPAYAPSSSTTSAISRGSHPQATVQRRTVSSPAASSRAEGTSTDVVDDVAISSGSRPSSSAPFESSLGQEPLDDNSAHDWSRSYHGLSLEPFSKDIADVLLAPLTASDIEIKPDGLIYLPEIKYRRILNRAFGPGGWGLAPRGETHIGTKLVSREYALVCLGRLVSVARGEQDYYDQSGIPTATEGCKSNALMRCCKDLGVASELWDPRFIRDFKSKHCSEVWGEHVVTKKKKKVWRRKDEKLTYPFEEK